MKYAHIETDTNKLLGWFDDKIHKEIPNPKIEVSLEDWYNSIQLNHNKVNNDGTTELFDFRTNEEKEKEVLLEKIEKAKKYLTDTEHKFNTDYTLKEDETLEDIAEIKATRKECRDFIRANK